MSSKALRLSDLEHCLHGISPAIIGTCGRDGTPNVAYLSEVRRLDDGHVALSCQFFNKTRRNLEENPHAHVEIYDPITFDAYHLELRYLRSESAGPLFDDMSARIEAIAVHMGLKGVFKLLSADVFELLSLTKCEDFLRPAPEGEHEELRVVRNGNELRVLQVICDRASRAPTLEELLARTLDALDELCGFAHSMVLVPDASGTRLVTLASRGYGESGIGAEVAFGEGLLGGVAETRTVQRFSALCADLRYGRAIREQTAADGGKAAVRPEIPLPGLRDPGSHLAIPLIAGDRLVGVLAIESPDPMAFEAWHEAFLGVLGAQIAAGIDRLSHTEEDDDADAAGTGAAASSSLVRRAFTFYRNDDCVFVDGEYLIRNVPGRILWKILRACRETGRTEFSNRELRLDESLGLPPVKDNLESRLILLRKRLEEKCPDVRIVPVRRGRFALEVSCALELHERDSA